MLRLLATLLSTFIATVTLAQSDTFSISGRAVSANTGNPIIGGSIMLSKNKGTTCDTEGRFLIGGLQQGKYKLSFRSSDYDIKDTVITIENNHIKGLVLTILPNCKSLNRQKAIKDIKRGKATLFINSRIGQSDQNTNKQFKEKYRIGFEFNDFGLVTEDCMLNYNEAVFEHLDTKYGNQWRAEIKVNPVGFKK